jgi:TPR repeat protein
MNMKFVTILLLFLTLTFNHPTLAGESDKTEDSSPVSHFMENYPELMTEVFSYLDIKDLAHASMVNKDWNSLAESNHNFPLWHFNRGLSALIYKNLDRARELLFFSGHDLSPSHMSEILIAFRKRNGSIKERIKQFFTLEVIELYRKAAQTGDPIALTNFGKLFEYGYGVSLDHVQARHWFEIACKQDHPMALTELGILYFWGRGVKQDATRAFDLFKRAAKKGNPLAQGYLVWFYKGWSNFKEANFWADKAMEAGEPFGFYQSGWLPYSTKAAELLEQGPIKVIACAIRTRKTFSKALGRARNLFSQGVELGDANSMVALGILLYDGQGGKKDRKGAMRLFQEAVDRGHPVERQLYQDWCGHGRDKKIKAIMEKLGELEKIQQD